MPAITGPIEVERLRFGAFTVGDVFSISPKSAEKNHYGSGSSVSGDRIRMYNEKSAETYKSTSISGQSISYNA
ncbi:spore germination protein [Metabacillus sp. GX 13764]|uniref:spore germination protein n=1 Tax=Metabacillus kandeliae TaxID=2900151 RepID=UPI001E3D8529|nr:spore germination protein [Metabacillus kandeliae]MCD7036210.1 spore germination protein [Metabacillus kandeliae]